MATSPTTNAANDDDKLEIPLGTWVLEIRPNLRQAPASVTIRLRAAAGAGLTSRVVASTDLSFRRLEMFVRRAGLRFPARIGSLEALAREYVARATNSGERIPRALAHIFEALSHAERKTPADPRTAEFLDRAQRASYDYLKRSKEYPQQKGGGSARKYNWGSGAAPIRRQGDASDAAAALLRVAKRIRTFGDSHLDDVARASRSEPAGVPWGPVATRFHAAAQYLQPVLTTVLPELPRGRKPPDADVLVAELGELLLLHACDPTGPTRLLEKFSRTTRENVRAEWAREQPPATPSVLDLMPTKIAAIALVAWGVDPKRAGEWFRQSRADGNAPAKSDEGVITAVETSPEVVSGSTPIIATPGRETDHAMHSSGSGTDQPTTPGNASSLDGDPNVTD